MSITLAQALRQKKQLVQEYLEVCKDAVADVRYTAEDTGNNRFRELLTRRLGLKEQIISIKKRIADANHRSGALPLIQEFAELKDEIKFWNQLKAKFDSDYVFRNSEKTVMSAMTKGEITDKICQLNKDLANKDLQVQQINHTYKLE